MHSANIAISMLKAIISKHTLFSEEAEQKLSTDMFNSIERKTQTRKSFFLDSYRLM